MTNIRVLTQPSGERDPTVPARSDASRPDFSGLSTTGSSFSLANQVIFSNVMAAIRGEASETTFSQYVLLRRLGRGGMGEVYAARDPLLEQDVAIKVIREELSSATREAMLLREARSLTKVESRHVIRLRHVGTHEGQLFLVMDYVQGNNLDAWAEEEHSLQEILDVFIQVARGLCDAHSAGVVHRDVKPSNILVTPTGEVKLIDFGIADSAPVDVEDTLRFGRDGVTSRTHGTLAYMAPEQLRRGEHSHQSDQFSFFVTFFEVLYGVNPFPKSSVAARLEAMEAGELSPHERGEEPGWLRRAIVRGLSATADQRFASMDEVLTILDHRRHHRRRRERGLVLAGACALAVVGVVASVLRPDPLADVWSSEERASITAKTTIPGPLVAEKLDGWAEAWVVVSKNHSSTREVEACLMGSLVRVGALVDELEHDRLSAHDAVEAVTELPEPSSCIGATLAAPLGLDHEYRAELERSLLMAELARRAGRLDDSEQQVLELVEATRTLKWTGAEVDALRILGNLRSDQGQPDAALETLRRAAGLAIEGGDIQRMGRLYLDMAQIAGAELDAQERLAWLTVASDVLGSDPSMALRIELERSRIHHAVQDHVRAEDLLRRAAETHSETLEDQPHLAMELHRRLADAIAAQGSTRRAEAWQRYEVALEIAESELRGFPEIRELAKVLGNAGVEAFGQGDTETARRLLERSLEVLRPFVDDIHPSVAKSLVQLTSIELSEGNCERAIDLATQAVEILSLEAGESLFWAHGRLAMAQAYECLGEREEALAIYAGLSEGRVGHIATIQSALLHADRPEERAIALTEFDRAWSLYVDEGCKRGDLQGVLQVSRVYLGLLVESNPEKSRRVGEHLTRSCNFEASDLDSIAALLDQL